MTVSESGPILSGAIAIGRALSAHPQSVRRWFRQKLLPGAFKAIDVPNSPIKISRADLAKLKGKV